MPYVVANPIAPRRPLRGLAGSRRGMRGLSGFYGLGQNIDDSAGAPFDLTPPPSFDTSSIDTSLPLPPPILPPAPPAIDPSTGLPLNPSAPPPPPVFVSSLPAPSASSASALQAGTLLSYTAQFTLANAGFTMSNLQQLIAQVSQRLLANWGIQVVNTILPSTWVDLPGLILTKGSGAQTLTLVVQLQNSYGQPADVKANIDHEMFAVLGNNSVVSSSIATCGNSISGCASSSGSSSWLAQNWPWLVGGGAAVLLAMKVME